MEEEDETDERVLDWWSKYFASIETLKEVSLFYSSLMYLHLHMFFDIDIFDISLNVFFAWFSRPSEPRRRLRQRRRRERTWR